MLHTPSICSVGVCHADLELNGKFVEVSGGVWVQKLSRTVFSGDDSPARLRHLPVTWVKGKRSKGEVNEVRLYTYVVISIVRSST